MNLFIGNPGSQDLDQHADDLNREQTPHDDGYP